MNISLVAEKTNYIKVDEKEIRVSTLAEPIRFEIETLDRLLQKRLDVLQEMEYVELAIKAKQAHVSQLVRESLNPSEKEV